MPGLCSRRNTIWECPDQFAMTICSIVFVDLLNAINTIKIFNEKNVDEIFIADIDCTVKNQEPNYKLISNLAIECRMPFCRLT